MIVKLLQETQFIILKLYGVKNHKMLFLVQLRLILPTLCQPVLSTNLLVYFKCVQNGRIQENVQPSIVDVVHT